MGKLFYPICRVKLLITRSVLNGVDRKSTLKLVWFVYIWLHLQKKKRKISLVQKTSSHGGSPDRKMLARRWEGLVHRTAKSSRGCGRDGRRQISSLQCCGCWRARDPMSPKSSSWSSSHRLSEAVRSQLGDPTPTWPASPRSPKSWARIPYVSLVTFLDLFSPAVIFFSCFLF